MSKLTEKTEKPIDKPLDSNGSPVKYEHYPCNAGSIDGINCQICRTFNGSIPQFLANFANVGNCPRLVSDGFFDFSQTTSDRGFPQ